MTVTAALRQLNKIADECADENYHTEAGLIWDKVIPAVNNLPLGRTVLIFVLAMDELHQLEVTT